ncbi:hypothetical protein RCL_jg2317.t2 [Rhizophagus clarus]|uniref:Uncharacterized protein n=1 Tax=Rhizophagus clarus TaxID=94130 RepID=A0A8H3KP72_9GLOM|nr:hypothetical protein RCL_jg2317.t2 [Rhizophagus clarus]
MDMSSCYVKHLKYIYGGILSLYENNSEIIKILSAADKLQELAEKYFLEMDLIRWNKILYLFVLSYEEFLQRVSPYKKLLEKKHYDNIQNSCLNPSSGFQFEMGTSLGFGGSLVGIEATESLDAWILASDAWLGLWMLRNYRCAVYFHYSGTVKSFKISGPSILCKRNYNWIVLN